MRYVGIVLLGFCSLTMWGADKKLNAKLVKDSTYIAGALNSLSQSTIWQDYLACEEDFFCLQDEGKALEAKMAAVKKDRERLSKTYKTLSSEQAEYKNEINRLKQKIARSEDPEIVLQCTISINEYENKLDSIRGSILSTDTLLNHIDEELDAINGAFKKLDEHDIEWDEKIAKLKEQVRKMH